MPASSADSHTPRNEVWCCPAGTSRWVDQSFPRRNLPSQEGDHISSKQRLAICTTRTRVTSASGLNSQAVPCSRRSCAATVDAVPLFESDSGFPTRRVVCHHLPVAARAACALVRHPSVQKLGEHIRNEISKITTRCVSTSIFDKNMHANPSPFPSLSQITGFFDRFARSVSLLDGSFAGSYWRNEEMRQR